MVVKPRANRMHTHPGFKNIYSLVLNNQSKLWNRKKQQVNPVSINKIYLKYFFFFSISIQITVNKVYASVIISVCADNIIIIFCLQKTHISFAVCGCGCMLFLFYSLNWQLEKKTLYHHDVYPIEFITNQHSELLSQTCWLQFFPTIYKHQSTNNLPTHKTHTLQHLKHTFHVFHPILKKMW